MTENNALVPAGGRGALANMGSGVGGRVISYEKSALLLLNKEAGRYLVGLYIGPRQQEVEKYKNPSNPNGTVVFEQFAVLETNAPSADEEKFTRGDTVSIMGGGQLSKDLKNGDVRGKFLKVEFLGKQSGQLKNGTPGNFNRYRVVDIDAEMRKAGFGDTLDAAAPTAAAGAPALEEMPIPDEPPPY